MLIRALWEASGQLLKDSWISYLWPNARCLSCPYPDSLRCSFSPCVPHLLLELRSTWTLRALRHLEVSEYNCSRLKSGPWSWYQLDQLPGLFCCGRCPWAWNTEQLMMDRLKCRYQLGFKVDLPQPGQGPSAVVGGITEVSAALRQESL